MKVLFTTSPGLGHLFPVVPLAWAARAAGHETLTVTTGSALEATGGAGLPAVDSAPGVDITDTFRSFAARNQSVFSGGASPMSGQNLDVVVRLFAEVSDRVVERTVETARAWCPDLVVHTPMEGAGIVAAAVLGVPLVRHGLGLSTGEGVSEPLAERLRPTAERLGVGGQLPGARVVVDTCPPSMRRPGATPGLPVRYISYNGGGALPDWLLEPPGRPRICVTLGSVVPMMGGTKLVPGMLEAFSTLDVDVILALGDADTSELGPLPANARLAGWVPLSELVPTCAALVHHGGSGTTASALVSGVPHLVLPHGADQHINGAAVAARGLGFSHLPSEVDADVLRGDLQRLLTDPEIRKAADEVRAENAERPSPADSVAHLEQLVA